MKKICEDAFYGLNRINFSEKIEVLKMLNSKSLFRYDGVRMKYETDKLEAMLTSFFNQPVVGVNNGTSALKLCLLANNIGDGDEVIVPCLSFISTASCCLSVGAVPIFCEIDNSFCIDPDDIIKKISDRTKAIIVVHYQGYPCNMERIMKIAKERGLIVIEDTAQAFGAKYKSKYLGTIGDSSAFSFQSCKIITCGEGGAITSKHNIDFINRYIDNGGYRPKGSFPTWGKDFCTYGENFKMTDIQSAILIKQFKKLNKIINNQRKIFETITKDLDGYKLRFCHDKNGFIPMSLCVIFKSKEECNRFIKYTNKKGIPFSDRINSFLPKYNVFENKKTFSKNNYPFSNSYKTNKCLRSYALLSRTAWLVLNSNNKKSDCLYISKVMGEYHEL